MIDEQAKNKMEELDFRRHGTSKFDHESECAQRFVARKYSKFDMRSE